MSTENFDVIIVGAGPAGCACALSLADSRLKIAVLDKTSMPHEKICGDALSMDVVKQLDKLPPGVKAAFENISQKIKSPGMRLFSPNNKSMEIRFDYANKESVYGYICKRRYLDEILINELKKYQNINLFENIEITDVLVKKDKAEVITNSKIFTSDIIAGADGANSIVSRKLSNKAENKEHLCIALRGYYDNVSGFHKDNFIEFHFYKDILPGYIWLFPMADNKANVGIGMLSNHVSEKKIILKNVLEKYINEHPNMSARFKNAKLCGKIEAWKIPLGSAKRHISGERFLLLGDAAYLVNPFTGEGIGNAIRSGRIAAEHIENCFAMKQFSSQFNIAYDNEIYNKMWNELKKNQYLQKLFSYPWLINYVVRRTNNNEHFRELIYTYVKNSSVRKKIYNPFSFYKAFIR